MRVHGWLTVSCCVSVSLLLVVEGDSRSVSISFSIPKSYWSWLMFTCSSKPRYRTTTTPNTTGPPPRPSFFLHSPFFPPICFLSSRYGSIVQVLCMYTTTPQEANASESKDTFSTPHTFLSFDGLYVACLEVAELNQARSKSWRPR